MHMDTSLMVNIGVVSGGPILTINAITPRMWLDANLRNIVLSNLTSNQEDTFSACRKCMRTNSIYITLCSLGMGCVTFSAGVVAKMTWDSIRRKLKLTTPLDTHDEEKQTSKQYLYDIHSATKEDKIKTLFDTIPQTCDIQQFGLLRLLSSTDHNLTQSNADTSPRNPSTGLLQRQLSTYSSYEGDNPPFLTQFSDYVTSDGGEILSPDSDVAVIIPKGAIPPGRIQQIFVNVSLSVEEFGLNNDRPDEFQLTPVVECLAPGLERFLLPVTVKLPHRANLLDKNRPWQFLPMFSQQSINRNMQWCSIPTESKTNQTKDVVFNFDEINVYMKSYHFTTFTCKGCGKKTKPPLKLSTVLFGNQKVLNNQQQVNFRVYICDTSTDVQKCIREMERPFNGSQQSQYKPLSVQNEKDWEVTISGHLNKSWPWRLHSDDSSSKIIPMDVCYHCCNVPPSVDFRCIPKDTSRQLCEIEASFRVAQIHRNRDKMVFSELVTHDFHFQEHSVNGSAAADFEEVATVEHLNYIQSNLRPKDLPSLARALGFTDPEIGTIKFNNPQDVREQIYQVLIQWKTRVGFAATVGKLRHALQQVNIKELADGIVNIVFASSQTLY